MTPEDALNIVDAILQGDRLNSLQRQVFCKAWADQSYVQIAQECGYELGYVKQVGAEVWQRLSAALHTKVTKKNLHRILHQRATPPTPPPASPSPLPPPTPPPIPPPTPHPTCDWGAAVDAAHFLGRDSELTHLRQWILDERCRLIGVVGMGGMGKTTLAAYLARQIQPHFDYVVWRSLRNAPPLEDLLDDLLQFFGGQPPVCSAATPDGRLHQLLAKLRQHRCLVVLDNCETILQQGSHGGHYLPGYAAYGQLWQCLGESAHRSTVLITSREKPREMAALEGVRLPVRSLTLNGLPPHLGRELFACKGDFCGSASTWELLVNHYAGNPLALKMVAVVVQDWFGGELERFLTCLQEGTSVFGDIQDLLAQQIDRLSPLEQQILDWLAIARTPLTLSQLRRCFLPGVPLGHLLAALTSLERRCLMDKTTPNPLGNRQICFTLQPVVMAFVTERFIQRIHEEIQARVWNGVKANQPRPRLMSHALIQTQTADHIRETQTRLILAPIAEQLRQQQSKSALVALFQDCVRALRGRSHQRHEALSPDWIGYAVGNAINLLRELDLDLSGWDFSRLPIRNANLRGLNLRGVNFTGADLSQAIFTETFGQVLSVAFSPDSTLLAAGDVNQEIHLWQVATGKKLLTLRVDEGWVWDVAFSPDGQTLATAANRSVKLWQVKTGACLASFTDYPDRVFSVSFSPDGSYLATGGEDHLIRVWCVRTGTLRWVLAGHEDEVRSVAFSPPFALSASRSGTKPGYVLASGSYDGTVRLWDLHQGTCLHVWRGHQGWVWSVAFSPDGQTLASGGSDRTLRLWDATSGQAGPVLTGPLQPIRTLAFSPDGRTLLSGSDDGTLWLWNYRTGQPLKVIPGHRSWLSAVTYRPDGEMFATSSEDQSVKLWDSRTQLCLKTFQGHSDGVWSVAIAPHSRHLASGSQDRLIRLWDLPTGELLQTLKGHTDWVWSVAFNASETLLASGSEDGTIRLWDLATGETAQVLTGHRDAAIAVAFTPDGQTLVSGSLDSTVRLWQVATGTCLRVLTGHTGGVWGLALSRDGEFLVSGSQDQTLKIWHLPTQDCLQTLRGHQTWIRSVAFSPDGQRVISGSTEGVIRQWHWASGTCDRTIQAHRGPVLALAVHPEGGWFASCGTDALIKWWDLATGKCLGVQNGHQRWIRSLAYSPDGQILASGSQDQTIQLWQDSPPAPPPQQTLRIPRPYEGMAIAHTTGLTPAQRHALQLLGAVDQPIARSPTPRREALQRAVIAVTG